MAADTSTVMLKPNSKNEKDVELHSYSSIEKLEPVDNNFNTKDAKDSYLPQIQQ